VTSQSQSNKTQVTADKAITVASTTDAVSIQAKEHVLLTAQGAYIKLEGGNIEVHAPGMVAFKAEMKSWTGPQSDSPSKPFFPTPSNIGIEKLNGELFSYQLDIEELLQNDPELEGTRYEIWAKGADAKLLAQGYLNKDSRTGRLFTEASEEIEIIFGENEWHSFADIQDDGFDGGSE
jgi:type VI secretion system secreted protein VgrG